VTDHIPLDLDALEQVARAYREAFTCGQREHALGQLVELLFPDGLSSIITELRSLRAAGEWVACSERMPEPREHVLAYEANALGIQAAIRFKDNAFETLDGVALENVTHWRPLPSPPVVQT
jgi:uncharacterized protein DUF551